MRKYGGFDSHRLHQNARIFFRGDLLKMELQTVTIKREDYVSIVEINHPPANTLSSQTITELREAFQILKDDIDTHAIIVTGAGRFFVAGADIKEFTEAFGDYDAAFAMAEAGQALCDEIEQMKKPVIAAINGAALGGGLELSMACHLRLAAEDAVLGLPELNLGLIPAFGGTQRLRKLVDMPTALEMILSSKQVKGKEAAEIGLVQAAVKGDELMDTALTLANSLVAGKSMTSVKRALECVVQGADEALEHGLERERVKFAELFLTDDAKEGITAFVEKRKPDFKHQ